MRYLVTARVKPGRAADLVRAIAEGTLGAGSVAGDEYLRNMEQARLCAQGKVRWIEICFCEEPLQEERPYWEEFFDFVRIQDAHGRHRCRDLKGTEPWACCDCDCTVRLEEQLAGQGCSFLAALQAAGRHPAHINGEAEGPAKQQVRSSTRMSSSRPQASATGQK